MAEREIYRVQLLDPDTGDVIKEVDIATSAAAVLFEDGKTFQEKYNSGELKGPKGDTGAEGPQGAAFAIAKVYGSIAEMNGGYENDDVKQGQFVIIDTGDIEDEDNAKLYVKGVSAYTYITDLSGATGMTGPQGQKGETGAPGAQGPKGDTGATGPKGDTGAAGADGKSAYEIWKSQEGNTNKTEAEFLASLKGAKGNTGPKGEDGDKIKVGKDYASAVEVKFFLKKM